MEAISLLYVVEKGALLGDMFGSMFVARNLDVRMSPYVWNVAQKWFAKTIIFYIWRVLFVKMKIMRVWNALNLKMVCFVSVENRFARNTK